MSSSDFNPFNTDDLTNPADWWQWVVSQHDDVISMAATRLGAAIIAGGLGVAGAQTKPNGSKLAGPTLGAAGLFAPGSPAPPRWRPGASSSAPWVEQADGLRRGEQGSSAGRRPALAPSDVAPDASGERSLTWRRD